ncbi:MAG TPA: glycosyltransferase [Azospirillum sp.]|nr:glycosyltransferase [Azospirillum sp.]
MSTPRTDAPTPLPGAEPAFAPRLALSVPRDSRAVLEICPAGTSIAARVKSANPAIRFAIVGLAPGASSAPELAAHLGPPRPLFDCLVVHDAVLALADPFGAIATARSYLTPGGTALIVVPRPWGEKEGMKAGTIPMDRIQDALAGRCGLFLDNAVVVPPPGPNPNATGQARGADFSHLIVRAVPANRPLQRFLIQAMTLRPVGACNDTRIHLPHAFLASIPGVRVQASVDHIPRQADAPPNEHRIAVLQRRICKPADLPQLRRILQQGYLIVAEFDDHPSHWPEITEYDNLTFRAVHAVQTSTDFLAGELRPFNDEIGVFPNQIATLPPPRQPRADGRVTLFFGAFNRDEDWRPLIAPLNRIIAANQGRVDVQVIHDRAFFDALETADKTFTPTCGYKDYIQILSRCDIGLLPLNDTLFNRCKSDLKFIECAAHGVVALASPIVYGGVVADGETGFLFRTPEEFSDRLTQLVGDHGLRAAIAGRAYDYIARNRLLAQHFRKRLDWYRSLLDRKAELDARLFARVPAVRP